MHLGKGYIPAIALTMMLACYFVFNVQNNLHLTEWLVLHLNQFLGRPFQRQKEWFRIILLHREIAGFDCRHILWGLRGVNTFFFGVFLVGYRAVAVVKASADDTLTWNNLRGRKSCHTAVDRTAGWNIPMGLLYSRINNCEFGKWILEGRCDQDQGQRGVLRKE